MKLDSYQLIRNWLPRLISIGAILVVAFTLYAIYQNVWQVFSSSKNNLILQKEVVAIELKTDLFKKIEERIENKKKVEELSLETIKNPFGFVSEEKLQVQQ